MNLYLYQLDIQFLLNRYKSIGEFYENYNISQRWINI